MNTGFVRPTVATVLTVYGIETIIPITAGAASNMLQQYLPFTVLKPARYFIASLTYSLYRCNSTYRLRYWNDRKRNRSDKKSSHVATVLTVYGIETDAYSFFPEKVSPELQQYLPFTVLKHTSSRSFAVFNCVATVLTVYGIETF